MRVDYGVLIQGAKVYILDGARSTVRNHILATPWLFT